MTEDRVFCLECGNKIERIKLRKCDRFKYCSSKCMFKHFRKGEKHRKNMKDTLDKRNEYSREYYKENPKKYRRVRYEYKASEKGKKLGRENYYKNKEIILIRKSTRDKFKLEKKCEICGDKENLQWHHWRYRMPLERRDFSTLCSFCHKVQHNKKELK